MPDDNNYYIVIITIFLTHTTKYNKKKGWKRKSYTDDY